MPLSFADFVPVAPLPQDVIARFADAVPEELVEFWRTSGTGLAAGGLLRVIDPARYLELIGERLPRPSMVPVFATGLGDLIVSYRGELIILRFRDGEVAGMSGSLRHLGTKIASESWADRFLDAAPYRAAAAMQGALDRPGDFDDVYAYKLAPVAGGPSGVENLVRARIFESIELIAQLAGPMPFAEPA